MIITLTAEQAEEVLIVGRLANKYGVGFTPLSLFEVINEIIKRKPASESEPKNYEYHIPEITKITQHQLYRLVPQ